MRDTSDLLAYRIFVTVCVKVERINQGSDLQKIHLRDKTGGKLDALTTVLFHTWQGITFQPKSPVQEGHTETMGVARST